MVIVFDSIGKAVKLNYINNRFESFGISVDCIKMSAGYEKHY